MEAIQLAIAYLTGKSNEKETNFQMRANKKYLEEQPLEALVEKCSLTVQEFTEQFDHYKVRDYFFKSNQMTTRETYLIHPLYDLYYTKLVFSLVLKQLEEGASLDFSQNEHMKIFCAGIFSADSELLQQHIMDNASYEQFIEQKRKYAGHHAIKMDVQNFFGSIDIQNLLEKLEKHFGQCQEIEDLGQFFQACQFTSLPQIHASIASSILSQYYLIDFDASLAAYLEEKKMAYIRYVDDMYFFYRDPKKVWFPYLRNDLNNTIIEFLLENYLHVNHEKTKFLTAAQYEKDIDHTLKWTRAKHQTGKTDYVEEEAYLTSDTIQQHAKALTESVDATGFEKFLKGLIEEKEANGIDQRGYRKLLNTYIAIPLDAQSDERSHSREVLETIIYDHLWENIPTDKLLHIHNALKQHIDTLKMSPFHLTTFSLKMSRYLEAQEIISYDQSLARKIYQQLVQEGQALNYKETVMACAYLLQNKTQLNERILKSIKNEKFSRYIETFF